MRGMRGWVEASGDGGVGHHLRRARYLVPVSWKQVHRRLLGRLRRRRQGTKPGLEVEEVEGVEGVEEVGVGR